jgi:glycosyltransferase involved in cell wall biosynthesis
VEIIDVAALIRKRPVLILVNSIITTLLYGFEIVLLQKKFRSAFWRTPYIFHQIRYLIRKRVNKEKHLFSFQMQSLFDGSTPGVPHFVYTDHTHLENLNYFTNNSRTLYSQKWIKLESEIYRNAALNFVRSSNVQRSIIKDYGCNVDRVRLVYAGSNASVSNTKAENISYTDPHILFIGFDWERKGGPDLIRAFEIVLQKCPDTRLTIVGAKPNIQLSNCEIVGPVPPEKLNQYYQRASIFCLPTHLEPFGVVLIEAMTARLPIVATRVGAIPDFVEDGMNGWLVEPGDIQGIADALIKLIENPDMSRRFGENGHKIAREMYSWQTVGRKFRANILNVLKEEQYINTC